MNDFSQYYEASEPDQRERAYGWATAIGLQAVDGLKTSANLAETAKRNIEGAISAAEARRLIDAYYETRLGHDAPADEREADKVAARINEIIHLPSFRLSPEYYIGLHGKIFEGVFPHAGTIREVDLTKREWVLNGQVRFENGALMQIETSFAAHIEENDVAGFWAMGTKGGCEFPSGKIFTDQNHTMVNITPAYLDPAGDEWDNLFATKLGNWVDGCLKGTLLGATGDDGLNVQRILNGLYDSAAAGGREVAIH